MLFNYWLDPGLTTHRTLQCDLLLTCTLSLVSSDVFQWGGRRTRMITKVPLKLSLSLQKRKTLVGWDGKKKRGWALLILHYPWASAATENWRGWAANFNKQTKWTSIFSRLPVDVAQEMKSELIFSGNVLLRLVSCSVGSTEFQI